MEKVKYLELLPHEFSARIKEQPIAYLPLGTLEWHGPHLALGADAIQSEAIMMKCAARFGGIVMPPVFLGPDRESPQDDGSVLYGMDTAETTTPNRQLPGSCYWVAEDGFHDMIDHILLQVKRAGFKAVFADGHGPSRHRWCDRMAEREEKLGLKLFGVTQELHGHWLAQMDHAAKNETSIMLAVRPDLVDMSKLPEDRDEYPQGVGGEDPREATPEFGAELIAESMTVLEGLFKEAGLLQE